MAFKKEGCLAARTVMVNVRHEGEAGQFAEVDADASGVRAGVRRLGLVARPAGLDGGLHAHGGVPLLFVWLAANEILRVVEGKRY